MANLLTRKVMDNMSRQYRKENGISSFTSIQKESKGNINSEEEALLLGLIKNNSSHTSIKKSESKNVKKINLEDLIGHSKQSVHKKIKSSSTITLDELVNKYSK